MVFETHPQSSRASGDQVRVLGGDGEQSRTSSRIRRHTFRKVHTTLHSDKPGSGRDEATASDYCTASKEPRQNCWKSRARSPETDWDSDCEIRIKRVKLESLPNDQTTTVGLNTRPVGLVRSAARTERSIPEWKQRQAIFADACIHNNTRTFPAEAVSREYRDLTQLETIFAPHHQTPPFFTGSRSGNAKTISCQSSQVLGVVDQLGHHCARQPTEATAVLARNLTVRISAIGESERQQRTQPIMRTHNPASWFVAKAKTLKVQPYGSKDIDTTSSGSSSATAGSSSSNHPASESNYSLPAVEGSSSMRVHSGHTHTGVLNVC